MEVRSYRDLIAWQKAMDLVEDVYKLTKSFPDDEKYGLTSQIKRAAVSIPSNIAEGQTRNSKKEFIHFLSIARGSKAEVETQLELAQRLGFSNKNEIENIIKKCNEVGKILTGLMKSLLTTNH